MSRLLLVSLLFGLSLATAESLVREIPSPAGPGSGQPYMTVSPDGRAYLSWIERLPERRFSLRAGNSGNLIKLWTDRVGDDRDRRVSGDWGQLDLGAKPLTG